MYVVIKNLLCMFCSSRIFLFLSNLPSPYLKSFRNKIFFTVSLCCTYYKYFKEHFYFYCILQKYRKHLTYKLQEQIIFCIQKTLDLRCYIYTYIYFFYRTLFPIARPRPPRRYFLYAASLSQLIIYKYSFYTIR